MNDETTFDVRHAAPGCVYESSKTYCHNVGLSVAFRQWRADSHCRFLHGYAIQVLLSFAARELDERNWVVDFGSLKSFKGWLEDWFDHKTLVASDDPELETFKELDQRGLIQMREVPSTGCEAMARLIWEYGEQWLQDNGYNSVILTKVTVNEHGANSASYGLTDQPRWLDPGIKW